MPSTLRAALREEFRPRSVAVLAAGLAALYVLTDASPAFLATVAAAGTLAGLASATAEAGLIDERLVRAALGAVVVVVGGVWAWSRTRTAPPTAGTLAVPLGAVALGLWILLDGVTAHLADVSAEPSVDREMDGREVMLTLSVAGTVFDALDTEEPKTVDAVAEECDLTESRVAESLAMCVERGMAEERPAGYVADPAHTGHLRPLVTNARRVGRRVLRPFRLLVD